MDDLIIDGSQKGGDGSERPAWMAQLPDNFKENETLSSFKTLGDLGSKFLEFDGQTKELNTKLSNSIPRLGESPTPEEVAEFRKASGVPETLDGYKFEKPEKFPEGFVYDEVLEKEFRELALTEHFTPKQAVALYNYHLNRELKLHGEVSKFIEENKSKAVNTLKDIWKGDAYKENVEKAVRTFQKFLENSNPPESFGGTEGVKSWIEQNGFGDDPMMLWFFSKVFDHIGDDKFIKGSPVGVSGGDVLDKMFPSMTKK